MMSTGVAGKRGSLRAGTTTLRKKTGSAPNPQVSFSFFAPSSADSSADSSVDCFEPPVASKDIVFQVLLSAWSQVPENHPQDWMTWKTTTLTDRDQPLEPPGEMCWIVTNVIGVVL